MRDENEVNKQQFSAADTCLFAFQDIAAMTLFCLPGPLHL